MIAIHSVNCREVEKLQVWIEGLRGILEGG